MPSTRRRLALPLVVLVAPPVYLLYREATACPSALGCSRLALAGYAALAVAALPAALLVARAAAAGRVPAWLAPTPDDRTLAALAAVVAGLAAFLLASAAGAVPGWLGPVLAPVGLALALPLVAVQVLVVGVGNAVGGLPMTLRLVAVAVGVGLSGAWWYLLAAGAAAAASRLGGPGDGASSRR